MLDWLELDAATLAGRPGLGAKRAATLNAAFAQARQRPFRQWLLALGLPPYGSAPLEGGWEMLAARSACLCSASWMLRR